MKRKIRGYVKKRWFHFMVIILVLSLGKVWGYSENECIRCHELKSQESNIHIDIDGYSNSVHFRQNIGCKDCHQNIKDASHENVKEAGKVNCQQCHQKKNLHSKDGSVSCYECHRRHQIYDVKSSKSSVYWKNLDYTCGRCHFHQSRKTAMLSILPSIQIVSHSKEIFGERFDRKMCVGCHQGKAAHGETVIINDQNCYKCHIPLATKSFLLGYIHINSSWDKQPISYIAGYIYFGVFIAVISVFVSEMIKRKRKK